MDHSTHQELANFIWSVADLLRGDFKQSDYGKVILPFTVLRRMECVLEPTRDAVSEAQQKWGGRNIDATQFLKNASGRHGFYNTTRLTLRKIADAPDDAGKNLQAYVSGFSDEAREVFDKFKFLEHVDTLAESRLLHQVVARFADTDLHPERVSNHQMGYVFEERLKYRQQQATRLENLLCNIPGIQVLTLTGDDRNPIFYAFVFLVDPETAGFTRGELIAAATEAGAAEVEAPTSMRPLHTYPIFAAPRSPVTTYRTSPVQDETPGAERLTEQAVRLRPAGRGQPSVTRLLECHNCKANKRAATPGRR